MNSDCTFYVFREGRKTVAGEQLLAGLRGSLHAAQDESGWTDALLRCGELECALLDAGERGAAEIARLTDACAEKLVRGDFNGGRELGVRLPVRLPGEFAVSTPEGFAYYALHPRQYGDVVERMERGASFVVIGIRSIGATLSAMTAAGLRARGAKAERFTVRPEGHPFERTVKWTAAQAHAIRTARLDGATFVIVDEGPGLSGSSFLSVAEALMAERVPSERIVLVPSHPPELKGLRAKDAEARWKRFRTVKLDVGYCPEAEWIGSGEWRAKFVENGRAWPGAWTNLERAKFLSRGVFWRFEGLGPYGAGARTRARRLAGAGFGPHVRDEQYGYVGYARLRGRAASAEDLNAERLRRMAEYCAFRAQEFRCEISGAQQKDLATMVRVNYERGFGGKFPADFSRLAVVRPTVCDAKMAPHEWLIAEDGRFLKLDAASHGDDHFFPGPCDIAWDLAGVIVEWEMDRPTREAFLREYRGLAHEDEAERIESYLLAYAVFRMAWTRMAAAGMKGTTEEPRLLRESDRYREYVERLVRAGAAAVPAARAS